MFQSGSILNKMFQAHEAHIPYILQFMIDYNLYGMNLVNLENVKFRRDPENPGKIRMKEGRCHRNSLTQLAVLKYLHMFKCLTWIISMLCDAYGKVFLSTFVFPL
jgi:hypothetical protein